MRAGTQAVRTSGGRGSRLVGVVVAVMCLGLVACTSTSGPAGDRSGEDDRSTDAVTSVSSGEAAITSLLANALYQLPVTSGERVSDGAVVFENALAQPFTLVSVEPVFQFGRVPDNVTVLGTRLVALDPSDPTDTGAGIQRGYPPRVSEGEQSYAVDGFQVPAGRPATRRQALVIGLSVDQGMAVIVGLQVRYRVGQAEYSQLISHQLILCADQPQRAARCPAPPAAAGAS